MSYGWMGKLLRVNLTDKTWSVESSDKYHEYIGGKGMANRIMYEEVPAGTEPTAPENKIVFAVGPNTAGSAPTSGRITLSSLSPFTKYQSIVDAHMGGNTAMRMKNAGYDALIIEGASDTPVYIYVNDDNVEIRDASDLWGTTTSHTTAEITKATVPGVNVVSIGKAGENLCNLSCVLNDNAHCGGGGIGKIFGSKKLKAVAFYGTKGVQLADPQKVQELNNYVLSDLIGSNNNHVVPTVAQSWSEYENSGSRWTGHPGLTWGAAEGGPVDTGESAPGQPTLVGLRCQKAVRDRGAIAEKYTVKMTGCAMCPIHCYGAINVPQMEPVTGVPGAHATTCLQSYGFIAGVMENVKDVEEEGDSALLRSLYGAILCDDYGLWDNYGDFLLLAFLVCASLFNTILDHGFVPLKHVSGSMRSSMRMASMVYLTVLFLYIKFIYEDNNYDSIIIYFIGMMIGRFVYFDATFHDFVSAMKQLRFALPFVGLALLVTALLALYGFHTQYLWKSNSVVISLLIAHLHMDLAIFILARSHFVSLFFRRQEESRREPVRRDKRRRGENAEEEDLSFEDIPDDDYGYDFYTDEETDPYESKSGRKRWR